jgi:hypothetical protein
MFDTLTKMVALELERFRNGSLDLENDSKMIETTK